MNLSQMTSTHKGVAGMLSKPRIVLSGGCGYGTLHQAKPFENVLNGKSSQIMEKSRKRKRKHEEYVRLQGINLQGIYIGK